MIAFAVPWALLGLLAASIPILLHLFARREPPTVEFPAVRYLTETARTHQRRLTVQHWILLLLRTLLIIVLVLAAAGPMLLSARAGGHAPSALVLVVDNSLSSGVTAGGTPFIERLRVVARAVLDRATPDDALWLVTATGTAQGGSAIELGAAIDALEPAVGRLDLGHAVTLGRGILAGDPRPGEVLVLTDLQATALSSAGGEGPVAVARPDDPVVANAGVAGVDPGPQPWTADGGSITIRLAGADTAAVPLSVTLGDRPARQALARPGSAVTVSLSVARRGWIPLVVELAPDELRADDRWVSAIRVAPPARVRWDPVDRFLAAAAEVLVEGRRFEAGPDVTLGTVGSGSAVVVPPEDPARIGAVNRALAARGVGWQYGPRVAAPGATDSSALLDRTRVHLRHRLDPAGSGETGVLIRVDGAPWMVRSGDVILLGSRFDPTWTDLPLSARFVPFLDALVNRVARGEIITRSAAPGERVLLPDGVDAVARDGLRLPVESGGAWRPVEQGPHFLLRGVDTVGVLSVNPDPRESDLRRADDRTLRALWPGVRVVDLDDAPRVAFRAASRGALRGPLLWLAAVLALAEAGLAAWRRRAT